MTLARHKTNRRRQRETLRALDEAKAALARSPDDPELRDAYDRAVEAYWSCH